MKNLSQMMKQAQEMQSRISGLQEGLSKVLVVGDAGGGIVQVTLNGKGEMEKINIDTSLVSVDELGVMEDLIVAAHKDAKRKVEARAAEEMKKLTGGIDLPAGFKLPI